MSESAGPSEKPGQGPAEPTRALPVLDPPDDPSAQAPDEPVTALAEQGRPRRFWSRRRVPAAVVALLLLGASGLLLYDVVAVRAGREAMQWRKSLTRELAERPLDDTWVLLGAGVAAALGLWLLLLALTPGRRAELPMRRVDADVRGALHRDTAATVLRDRAMEVSGVQSAQVRVRRRKAQVRVVSHFRELDDVGQDLRGAMDEAMRQLGLGHPPPLDVRVRRPGRRG